ncbi:GNAT family N-acetyltransferase [Streptosporangium sp. 'caverna']|uniref:GNAT family N-acetyltransferase n=1 Tax=Streptosporangium sp. 'caverna' TaxID=2202249 RepID=UPI000D7D48E1|nr:GNAT family N-acetyltransferase [Streptosporangium sp. 'caverna']AWS42943.1 GNAT family N-acetyltransferase [Streptosporangium sp. 'caverna']
MTHKIRPGVPEDVEAREYVRVATWKTAYRGIMPDDYLDALKVEPDAVAGMEEGLAGALAEGRTPLLVGEIGGRIAGFVNFGRCRDERIGGGEVFALYVLPEAQADGLGYALMTAAVERLRADGHEEIGLWVAAGNAQARHFYERFGFVSSGRVQRHSAPLPPVEEVHYRLSPSTNSATAGTNISG